MSDATASEAATPPFTAFVESLKPEYPELEYLSQLLTGKYPPHRVSLVWSTSTKVDVIIVDIKHDAGGVPAVERVQDIEHLRRMATEEIPETIALRLYLVEDMTAPVIELLGSSYECCPFFFQRHMRCMGVHAARMTDGNGVPHEHSWVKRSFEDNETPPPSELRDLPFFSLPFRRWAYTPRPKPSEAAVGDRTMFREYDQKNSLLEERVTGLLVNPKSRKPAIGIFLFDSMPFSYQLCDQRPRARRSLFSTYPRFMSSTVSAPSPGDHDDSLRGALLAELRRTEFVDALAEDNSTVIWAILKSMSGAWQEVVRSADHHASLKADGVGPGDDNRLLLVLMDGHAAVKDNIVMLRQLLITAKPQGYAGISSKPGTRVSTKIEGVIIDIEDLVKRSENQLAMIQQRIATLAALRSIHESQKAINQAELIGAFTALATIYIPFSFTSSLFGMNVKEISAETTSIWIFSLIAVLLTCLSIGALVYRRKLANIWEYLFDEDSKQYSRIGTSRERRAGLPKALLEKVFGNGFRRETDIEVLF
ncbi:hypothetical protein QBC47DRAFT_386834 [Echria macrotheca]|uniref:Uncharacterized protein n=1 Tax=Echria macrotheca TaxID=438768 RepID=A0AAJ0B8H6_9PEZI|nr:hypothetical protein QBC47DRAFT_386834 [Echria macrotheca]